MIVDDVVRSCARLVVVGGCGLSSPPRVCMCASFLDSRVLTCDIAGENPTTEPGSLRFLACWPATLPVAGQSGLTSSRLVESSATVGSQLLLLCLVDEQGHPRPLLHHLDQQGAQAALRRRLFVRIKQQEFERKHGVRPVLPGV